ncbi:MAG: hypothetical protein FWB88_07210 [Defluviitaleaceae bacterium]|nr:hypothetical protein [Defluviitaleaceae bacterium]MCL2239358.1 hypothetical protein [Defluviitaleaceae bacterium]
MKKALALILMGGLFLLCSACGVAENGEAYAHYLAATPVPAPAPASTPAPVPIMPPVGNMPHIPMMPPPPGAQTPEPTPEPEVVSPLPVPEVPIAVPVTGRTLSAGGGISTALDEDGGVWIWGGWHQPTRWAFVWHVVWLAGEGRVFLWPMTEGTVTFNLENPEDYAFKPVPDRVSGDGINNFIYCYHTNARRSFTAFYITDAEGNSFGMNELVAMMDLERALTPRLFTQGAASVRVHMSNGTYYMITEAGTLYRLGNEEPVAENVADFVGAQHGLSYIGVQVWQGMTFNERQSIRIYSGVLHTDGTFYFMDANGNIRQPVVGHVIAMDYGMDHMLLLSYDGHLYARGSGAAVGMPHQDSSAPPARIMEDVAHIAAGSGHSMAVTQAGRLYTWGRNTRGQLGVRGRQDGFVFVMDNITAISAGDDHTMAITAEGALWGWGCNQHGQVGVDTAPAHLEPVFVMDNVAAVSAGYDHTLALTYDGILWAFGRNNRGQLGDGTQYSRGQPVQVMTGVMLP